MGSTQFSYDEHGRQTGLDWDALRPAEPERKLEVVPDPPRPYKSKPVNPIAARSRRGDNLRGGSRPPRYDYKKIAALWSAGKSKNEIMAEIGCGATTVTTALKAIRPEGYQPGVKGPRRQEKCQRGHDMATHGKEIPKEKGGGRFCSECKRMRERVR